MLVIGVTGNSGAGKSTISKIISQKYNAKLVNSDKIARDLSKNGTGYFKDIIKCFGTEILQEDNEINRSMLAEIIYKDKNKREKLNKLTNKHVVKQIQKEIQKHDKNDIVVIDVPLLFESNLNKECNIVISVIAKQEIKIERLCKRDKLDISTAKQRLSAQQNDKLYIEKSDYIIENNIAKELENQIDKIMKQIIKI